MLRHLTTTALTVGLVASVAISANAQNANGQKNPNLKETAMKLVPESKITKEDGNEFDLMTAKQTVIEVELNKDGTLDEASGNAALTGDVFVPGNGLMSLSDAIAALQKAGKTPAGDWSIEKSFMNDWIYEFEGTENGKAMEYAVSAKDGKLVKDRRDIF
jgi:uncharacterized membrane protein YkoI